jgi:hypothetical protein
MKEETPDYRFYEGWHFHRLDKGHIELFQRSFCVHCHRTLAKDGRIFPESDDRTPLAAGLHKAEPPTLRGKQPVEGSMDFCDDCLDAD